MAHYTKDYMFVGKLHIPVSSLCFNLTNFSRKRFIGIWCLM